jgi:hypothetical protein
MLVVTPRVWTTRRKVLGNLVPALFWFPPACYGVLDLARKSQFIGPGLWYLASSTVIGILAVNQFGFFENGTMRRQLELILKAQEAEVTGEYLFVGFATPKYSSMLDAHEDVGFLQILDDRLVFVSESRRLELMKADIKEVRTRPNAHSILGLGRWVSVDSELGDKRFRLLVEPREKATMLGSSRYSKRLVQRIQEWLKESAK